VAPVLVDGLFPHTAASITIPKGYSYDLTLPMKPCDKCTLQVIQIMLHHANNQPYGYTYHHCADISIGGAATVGALEAGSEAPDATTSGPRSGGCAVTGQRESTRTGFAGLAAVILASRRLRRRGPSSKTAIIHLERRLWSLWGKQQMKVAHFDISH
jgi:hypothetical protein